MLITAPDQAQLTQATSKFMGRDPGTGYLETPGALCLVAVDDSEVHGWCWGYHLPRPDGTSMAYLHQIEVDTAYRRQGIGRELLRTFMTACTQDGATKLFLSTAADNLPARTLYDAMGGGTPTQGPTVNYWFLLPPAHPVPTDRT